MGALTSARILAAGTTWRLTGIAAAGNTLLTAVTTGNDTERTLAGMLLVKAGSPSVTIISHAILNGNGTAELVDVLASINTDEARSALITIAQQPPFTVAQRTQDAATEALRTLDHIRRHHEEGS